MADRKKGSVSNEQKSIVISKFTANQHSGKETSKSDGSDEGLVYGWEIW